MRSIINNNNWANISKISKVLHTWCLSFYIILYKHGHQINSRVVKLKSQQKVDGNGAAAHLISCISWLARIISQCLFWSHEPDVNQRFLFRFCQQCDRTSHDTNDSDKCGSGLLWGETPWLWINKQWLLNIILRINTSLTSRKQLLIVKYRKKT